MAEDLELHEAASYAHIFLDGKEYPSIAATKDGEVTEVTYSDDLLYHLSTFSDWQIVIFRNFTDYIYRHFCIQNDFRKC